MNGRPRYRPDSRPPRIKSGDRNDRALGVALSVLVSAWATAAGAASLPDGFVYLRDADPSIVQDIRYAAAHNFVGRPIDGYQAGECVLTREAAAGLTTVQ